jgi:predicted nuclease of restriction endonuclease-like (RecB) superfamily
VGYLHLLNEIKRRIRAAHVKAGLAVNKKLVLLYWTIGRDILIRQKKLGWGAKVIGRLAQDLRRAFPEMQGFSPRNLKYMRAFARAYPDESFVQVSLAQITWYHNITLLQKVPHKEKRLWYVRQTVENGWSRDVLVHQIEGRLYERQGKAVTNFKTISVYRHESNIQKVLQDFQNALPKSKKKFFYADTHPLGSADLQVSIRRAA